MPHDPSLYRVSVPLASSLVTFPAVFDSGDVAYVAEFDAFYSYNASASDALATGVVLAAAGGVGRWIIESRHTYGGIYVTNGATPQALNATPQALTCFTAAQPSNKVTCDFANNRIVIVRPGDYQVTISLSGNVSGGGQWDFHIYKNGVSIPGAGITRLGSTSTPLGGTALAFVSCAANDILQVYGDAQTGTPSITIVEASLTVVRMA